MWSWSLFNECTLHKEFFLSACLQKGHDCWKVRKAFNSPIPLFSNRSRKYGLLLIGYSRHAMYYHDFTHVVM